jgi:hypothetical protein
MLFRVISPDGIPDRSAPYATRKEAERAKTAFIGRFRQQGYYLDANCNRIPLADLPGLVKIQIVRNRRKT